MDGKFTHGVLHGDEQIMFHGLSDLALSPSKRDRGSST